MKALVLDEFVYEVTFQRAKIIEEHIRLVVRPRPRWVPQRLWYRLVAKVLVMEVPDAK